MRRLIIVVVLSSVLFTVGAWAQSPTPKGDQFQVNTYTQSNQGNPAVAVGPLGNFVVVWQSTGSPGDDASGDSIQAQRYDAAGNLVGAQFQVNTQTTSSQREAAVAMDGQGNFVVVWRSPDGDSWGIHGQRFDAAGNPLGDEFEVNTYTADDQSRPAIAMNPAGNFVVVWESFGSNGSDTSEESVQGQLYDPMGAPVGGQFQVNTNTSSRQEAAQVAMDNQGNFIVVWDYVSQDSVRGQLYSSTGATVGGEFQIETSGYGSRPDVAMDPQGNFAVVWTGAEAAGTDSSDGSIQLQRFDANGNQVGNQAQVNTYVLDWQEGPTVAMDGDGNMIIIWESEGSLGDDSDGYSIQAQYYESSKTPAAGEFQINTHTPGDQVNPAVGVDGSGDFVVTWNSDNAPGDMSSRSVHARRYSAGADPILSAFFESGDTSEWTTSVP